MRSSLLLFFLAFLYLIPTAIAQYEPMAVENRYWIYEERDTEETGQQRVLRASFFSLVGDTIVDGIDYKKVYEYELEVEPSHPYNPYPQVIRPFTVMGNRLIALVRDDVAERKVYAIPLTMDNGYCSTEEHLLYDFSLTAGDTLNDCAASRIYTTDIAMNYPVVDSINQQYFYGAERKVFNTYGIYTYQGLLALSPVEILEGIGFSYYGLFNFQPMRNYHMIDFCEGAWEDCNIVSSATNLSLREKGVELFPNPTQDRLQLKSPIPIQTLEVYNTNGALEWRTNPGKEVDLSSLSPGLKILKLYQADGQVFIRKISKL